VLPRQLVEMFQQMTELVAYEPPFPQPRFPLAMLWHQCLSKDPGHLWLRNTLTEVASTIEVS
jgi:DNA-binding transcriptional LysR family regulator